jgi:hypothetical protein
MEALKEMITKLIEHESSIHELNHLIETVEVDEGNILLLDDLIASFKEYEAEIRGLRQALVVRGLNYRANDFLAKNKKR